MEVVILCGGLGTRLREETEFKPKPMVKIGNYPILWHIMKSYAHYGFKDFVLSLGYKGEVIKEYFYNYEIMNSDFTVELGKVKKIQINNKCKEEGWKITLANSGDKALKGARLKRIEQYIVGDNFMMTYGDGVSDIDISKVLDFHLKHGKMVTVTGVSTTSRFGKLQIDGNKVTKFCEKPYIDDDLINGGFFVLNRKVFDFLEDNDSCDWETDALEKIALKGELMVYKHNGFWACMDTLRDVEHLNKLWHDNKAEWKVW